MYYQEKQDLAETKPCLLKSFYFVTTLEFAKYGYQVTRFHVLRILPEG